MKDKIARAAEHHLILAELRKPKPKPVKTKKVKPASKIDKLDILSRRGYLCQCGCGQRGEDLHHALIGRKKGCPQMDDERNLVLVNHEEHIARTFDTLEWRRKFWDMQCDIYGTSKMYDWLYSLPPKIRLTRTDWL